MIRRVTGSPYRPVAVHPRVEAGTDPYADPGPPTRAVTSLVMENHLPSVVIGIAVLALVIRRQLRASAVTPPRTYVTPLILFVYGIGLLVVQDHGRVLDPAHATLSAVLLAGELVAAVLLGLLRAATVTVWRDPDGTTWRRGNGRTVAAWIGSILVRVAFATGGAYLGVHSGTGEIMVFVAVTLLAQNLFVEWRGRSLPIAATVQA